MRILACGAIGAFALGLAACGAAPPKPTPVQAALVVSGDVNPDAGGRASPVVLRLYQLKEEGSFNDAGYFALVDKEQQTLGPSLVTREEYPMDPGQTRSFELKMPPEVHFIGVIAGYRDIDNAKWKAVLPVAAGLKKVNISVGKSQVAIAAGK